MCKRREGEKYVGKVEGRRMYVKRKKIYVKGIEKRWE